MRDRNIDRVIEGLASPFWAMLREAYQSRFDRELRNLRGCGPGELQFLQGRLDALDWAIRQPEEMLTALRDQGESPQEETDGGGP